MSNKVFTHVRLSAELWKRINREREPNESLEDSLKRQLDERDRLRQLIKVDPNAIETTI
jgi:hypothetical protein